MSKKNAVLKKQVINNQAPIEEEEELKNETEKREITEHILVYCKVSCSENLLNAYYIDNYSELPFFDIIKPPPIR